MLKISINDPKSGTLEASKMIKQTTKTYGILKRYKKAVMTREKEYNNSNNNNNNNDDDDDDTNNNN